MLVHPNSIIPEAARARVVTECAQCGERLFAPELSEYVDVRLVAIFGNVRAAVTPLRRRFLLPRLRPGVASTSARRPFSEISQVALKDFLCAFENR